MKILYDQDKHLTNMFEIQMNAIFVSTTNFINSLNSDQCHLQRKSL